MLLCGRVVLARAYAPEMITKARQSSQSRCLIPAIKRWEAPLLMCHAAVRVPLITIRGCGRGSADGSGLTRDSNPRRDANVHHFRAPWREQIVPCRFTLSTKRGVAPSLRSSALKVMEMTAPPLRDNSLKIWRLQSFASRMSLWVFPVSITALELGALKNSPRAQFSS